MTAAALRPDEVNVPARRSLVTPATEALVLIVAITIAVGSYLVVSRSTAGQSLLAPATVAGLLVANLVPDVALIILLGRRIAKRRAARSPIGGEARLHVRLVAMFSIIAAVPALLVAVFASLLFQYGVEFWSSHRAQSMLENATTLARVNYDRQIAEVANETRTMSGDIAGYLREMPIDGDYFSQGLLYQTRQRELSEAMIVRSGEADPLIVLNPYGRPLRNVVTPAMMRELDGGARQITFQFKDRAAALVPLAYGQHTYLYAARVFDEDVAGQFKRGTAILADYRALQARSRVLQLRFNVALLLIALFVVAIAVFAALTVADRLVRPVGEMMGAAQRVTGGDLSARVPDPKTRDEVGTLARAFNTMTERIQQQNTALDNRRALIEAVMAGVSAGVIATDAARTITIANASAIRLLGAALPGRSLAEVAPALDLLVRDNQREAIVEVGGEGERRTLAVRIARADGGGILTFDDITQQQLDQRRAAWADVARRIAHEIKNPLTPIQLAAERLQRRYGGKVEAGDTTFQRLTDTIVRQVGDLRRMVDEFSSFARMPKPVFRDEPLVDIARQTLFLHEVAHPGITFSLDAPEAAPHLVCDRRQIGQALTNLVKNAAEAIEAADVGGGAVTVTLAEKMGRVTIAVTDTGVGLPADRERILEPYVTTRVRGTGLGLAIVKKIVEEHGGTVSFADRDGGGSIVCLEFDATALAQLDQGAEPAEPSGEEQLAQLVSMRS